MNEVVPDTQQEFWRAPVFSSTATSVSTLPITGAAACYGCGREFMVSAHFCHNCGIKRLQVPAVDLPSSLESGNAIGLWPRLLYAGGVGLSWVIFQWETVAFPTWMRYLHFHEIKRWVGLPTGALVAFLIGLGCVAGMVGVSLFYRASNLIEFQAIQMWRIEWLLGATAAFVAGLLLKNSSNGSD